ncbi:hypothetical protein NECAME_17117 [Necator americanus]|uniref:Uncharacterized protein n=1 Tax=Necator americanus TaxID=51031 RepID=W2TS93_NECAM|nr:hypothetical protein NECAME_17117 [Necator americanus]ETN84539.1 hypothetical protein NECAME_17117 [Necator americanus]
MSISFMDWEPTMTLSSERAVIHPRNLSKTSLHRLIDGGNNRNTLSRQKIIQYFSSIYTTANLSHRSRLPKLRGLVASSIRKDD